MLDIELYGAARPSLHHLSSLLLHLLNVFFLYLLMVRLSGRVYRALFIAAVFALHPLHVESVAWIAERKDVLSTCFWLASLLAYERHARTERWAWYVGSLLLLALGLMSKSMLVTAPFVFLLLDAWPLRRLRWRAVAEKIPMFALIVATSVATYFVQASGAAMKDLPLTQRLATALVAYPRYMAKIFWPSDLAVLYPLHAGVWSTWQVVGSAALLLLLTAACLRWRQIPALGVGWFWFLGTLVPVLGLVQVGEQSMADRYSYVPMIGFSIAVVWGFEKLREGRLGRSVAWTLGLVVCLALAARTSQHLPVWRDSERLYTHALSVTRDNMIMHNNLASLYFGQNHVEAAIRQYRAATAIYPKYFDARRNLVFALQAAERNDEAIAEVMTMVGLFPEDHSLVYELGRLQEHYGNTHEARVSYERYLQLAPDDAEAWNGLGRVSRGLGDLDAAAACFRRAMELNADHREAHWNLAAVLVESGRPQEAVAVLQAFSQEHVFDRETRQMLDQLKGATE
jgi:tetratricopeptide (TPR) repeat protein